MKTILKQFIDEPLFDACTAMLNHLHITFNEVTRTPIALDGLYPGPLTKALKDVCGKLAHIYFIGTVDEASLARHTSRQHEEEVTRQATEGHYVGMMIFAVEVSGTQVLTRSEIAMLTRGFNRIAAAQPVILFIRQGDRLALATCERSEYTQQWRDGEKLGKVSMLRDINCQNPHRGHIDILNSIGDKAYPTFEELYKHWMQVFSSELLTKKFYGELSDWYAWAVQVARFPNDLTTSDDDEKFNYESCIRLITRLIFVWFLKQKHLIPEEFFDEQYIREHFIEEFNPHDRKNLLYNPEKSRYYRLILQNLFFAMLNRPITPEGKDVPNNRRFRTKGSYHGMNPDYGVNNLMRYESEFMASGADEFMKLANSYVPFLNGGLFDCLDDKPKNLYYDGFSERRESLDQLYLPDWLFFGNEVGHSIDLSTWYGDTKKKKVSASGIIDILKRYNFTIEENTPLDQEVSLDPELLGKAFENLLASYNPETKTSARKQTGSFYTPREIVQYMVDESLVAHLKRTCGEELETEYRSLLNYATEETTLNEDLRRQVMQALYHCRVLDPACGSGAFPMGVLQQMVHILRQLDPTNEMWKEFMRDIAIEQSRKAYSSDEKEERKVRLADIEEAFDKSINDPDYARKLYLIEHCIFGVDIQPIAVQISKLRFFISLVVDQKPTNDAAHNFGIRPLPNLESKFVAANTLIPVDYDTSLFESTDAIIAKKEQLKELNHKIFLAKRNIDKQRLKEKIKETRKVLAKTIEETGFVNPGAAQQLADWDMFEQNTSSPFFDAEWMFGVKGGFDIVIANPPFVRKTSLSDSDKIKYEKIYESATKQYDLYLLFIEKGVKFLSNNGYLSYINPIRFFNSDYGLGCRKFIIKNLKIISVLDISQLPVFQNVLTYPCVLLLQKEKDNIYNKITYRKLYNLSDLQEIRNITPIITKQKEIENDSEFKIIIDVQPELRNIIKKIDDKGKTISSLFTIARGLSNNKVNFCGDKYYALKSTNVKKYHISGNLKRIDSNYGNIFKEQMIILPRTVEYLQAMIKDKDIVCLDRIYYLIPKSKINLYYVLGVLNSALTNNWFEYYYKTTKVSGNYFDLNGNQIGSIIIPFASEEHKKSIANAVDKILKIKKETPAIDTSANEQEIDALVYHLYGLTYDEILIIDPDTPITREEYEGTIQ